MLKHSFYQLLLAVILLGAESCQTTDLDCVRASLTITTELRPLEDFVSVAISANVDAEVIVRQAQDFSFELTGPENVVELTSTQIEDGFLIVSSDGCFNGEDELTMVITAPDYEVINKSGAGKLSSGGSISVDKLQIDFLGTGEVETEIFADTLITNMAGNGVLDYTGEVHRHILNAYGIYTMNSFPLQADHVFINLIGEGDSFVTANETLTVFIEGHGNVFYKGKPVLQSDIVGTGEVIDAN